MPLYEYVCQQCGQTFEKLVSMSRADEPQPCPACAGAESRRKLSSFSVGGGGNGLSIPAGPPAGSPFT